MRLIIEINSSSDASYPLAFAKPYKLKALTKP